MGKEITSLVFWCLLPKQVPSVLSSKIMNNFCAICHLEKTPPKPLGCRFEVVWARPHKAACLLSPVMGGFAGFYWPFCFPFPLFSPLLNIFFSFACLLHMFDSKERHCTADVHWVLQSLQDRHEEKTANNHREGQTCRFHIWMLCVHVHLKYVKLV